MDKFQSVGIYSNNSKKTRLNSEDDQFEDQNLEESKSVESLQSLNWKLEDLFRKYLFTSNQPNVNWFRQSFNRSLMI